MPTAITSTPSPFIVSWDLFHRDCKMLSWHLMALQEKTGVRWQGMAVITRGGLAPGAIVARELNIRLIDCLCISSYLPGTLDAAASDDTPKEGAPKAASPNLDGLEARQSELQILKPLSERFSKNGGEHILIIDDLVDTGKTGKAIRKLMPKAHFATVYAKTKGKEIVDTFVTEVSQDTWIIFPWDTDLQFSKPMVGGED